MLTFNLRLKVVSRIGIKFEKHINTFFCRAFSRIHPPKPKLFPHCLLIYPPTFKKLYWPSQEITKRKKNKPFHYLCLNPNLWFKKFSGNQYILAKREFFKKGNKKKKNLQLKLLCTLPWSHFPPSFPER